MSEPILTELERQLLKSAALMLYQKTWGKPNPAEYTIIIRTIDAMGEIMAEAGSLDA